MYPYVLLGMADTERGEAQRPVAEDDVNPRLVEQDASAGFAHTRRTQREVSEKWHYEANIDVARRCARIITIVKCV